MHLNIFLNISHFKIKFGKNLGAFSSLCIRVYYVLHYANFKFIIGYGKEKTSRKQF